jgi:2-methylcitrate dehydratase PrpD
LIESLSLIAAGLRIELFEGFDHAAAVALIDGAGGDRQFSDQRVNDPTVVALRNKVSATADTSLTEVQARVRVTLKSGEELEKRIEQVVGSAACPMSDAQLEAKVRCLGEENLSVAQADRMIETCWRLSTLEDAGEIARCAVPS